MEGSSPFGSAPRERIRERERVRERERERELERVRERERETFVLEKARHLL